MKFLVDAQLPIALARYLSASGYEALHVVDVSLSEKKDSAIWDYALAYRAAIITKDEDFAIRITLNRAGPPVVWLRIGNCRKRVLIEWFAKLLPNIIESLQQGDRLIEVV